MRWESTLAARSTRVCHVNNAYSMTEQPANSTTDWLSISNSTNSSLVWHSHVAGGVWHPQFRLTSHRIMPVLSLDENFKAGTRQAVEPALNEWCTTTMVMLFIILHNTGSRHEASAWQQRHFRRFRNVYESPLPFASLFTCTQLQSQCSWCVEFTREKKRQCINARSYWKLDLF